MRNPLSQIWTAVTGLLSPDLTGSPGQQDPVHRGA
jgi:hypothetical protein